MVAILFLVDAALVAGLGVWMTVAVADNWIHPRLNEEAVALVVRMELMEQMYPDDFAIIAHRRIDSPELIGRMFRTVRLFETLAAVLLLLSALLLALAAAGVVAGTLATGAAILSSTLFVSIWAGFVIGGNYFAYWYCHQWAQSNHFMLMYWGFFVLLVLML
ncbi:DUF2165 family protein [Lutimaribacter marinistellae]|uniref:DUF2165 family protein n=1 Tax=Lutimaribacter marinistellae TaxID=1820329 RepID=A0ABV7TET0_9RHOB